jgi:hypothetical protein
LRKPLIGAVVGLITMLVFAGTASATFTQGADISFTKPKANSSTGIKSNISATETDPSIQQPKASSNVVVNFPSGTKFNTKVPPVCSADAATIQQTNGAACEKKGSTSTGNATVGTGQAMANVKPLLNTDVALSIKAYNAKGNKIIFYLVPQGGVGNPLVLTGTTKGNKLSTPVPRIEAVGGSGVFAVLTSFVLTTKAISKSGENYVTTPKSCPGKWTTKTNFTYTDGSSGSVSSTQPCKK